MPTSNFFRFDTKKGISNASIFTGFLICLVFSCANNPQVSTLEKIIVQEEVPILYDSLDTKEISVSGLNLNSRVENVFERFGTADSVLLLLNEFEDYYFYQYQYDSSKLTVEDSLFTGFEFYDKRFILDNGKIQVGDSVVKIQTLFPLSYKNRLANGDGNEIVRVSLINSRDDYILFDLKDGCIKFIITWRIQ